MLFLQVVLFRKPWRCFWNKALSMWHNNRRFYEGLTLGRWARSVTISAGSGALNSYHCALSGC